MRKSRHNWRTIWRWRGTWEPRCWTRTQGREISWRLWSIQRIQMQRPCINKVRNLVACSSKTLVLIRSRIQFQRKMIIHSSIRMKMPINLHICLKNIKQLMPKPKPNLKSKGKRKEHQPQNNRSLILVIIWINCMVLSSLKLRNFWQRKLLKDFKSKSKKLSSLIMKTARRKIIN